MRIDYVQSNGQDWGRRCVHWPVPVLLDGAVMPEGTIRKLSKRGFGFITTPDRQELFFHSSQLAGCLFEDLREGQRVAYIVRNGPKGPQAEQVQQLPD